MGRERRGFYMVAISNKKEFSVLHFISINVCLIIHVNAILNKNVITKIVYLDALQLNQTQTTLFIVFILGNLHKALYNDYWVMFWTLIRFPMRMWSTHVEVQLIRQLANVFCCAASGSVNVNVSPNLLNTHYYFCLFFNNLIEHHK